MEQTFRNTVADAQQRIGELEASESDLQSQRLEAVSFLRQLLLTMEVALVVLTRCRAYSLDACVSSALQQYEVNGHVQVALLQKKIRDRLTQWHERVDIPRYTPSPTALPEALVDSKTLTPATLGQVASGVGKLPTVKSSGMLCDCPW